jgi:hypothetical protein
MLPPQPTITPAPIARPAYNEDDYPDFQYPSGKVSWCYRIVGIMLVTSTVVGIGSALIFQTAPNYISMAIDILLAIGLFMLKSGARKWTLVRAILGAVLMPIMIIWKGTPLLEGVITIALQLGYCAAMILLLTGTPKPWRFILSIGIFGLTFLGLIVLLFFGFIGLMASQSGGAL